MPDHQKTLFTSNFKKAQLGFLKLCAWFFGPLILISIILEILTLNLPSNFKTIGNYLDENADKIEVLVVGSSKLQSALNPEWMNKPAINLASSSQHLNEDFAIIKGTIDRMPELEYVVFELSDLHLELPLHTTKYWKNNIFLKYYKVNAFDRPTYFGDRLIFLSNASYFFYQLEDYYIRKNEITEWNEYGFDTNRYLGAFRTLEYDEEKIRNSTFLTISWENKDVFRENTALVFKMLDYLKSKNQKVIICSVPNYKAYLPKANQNAIRRRDSILGVAAKRYSNVTIFNKEADTLSYTARDFTNVNHFNPDGAKIFTAQLNHLIDSLDQASLNFSK